MVEHSLQLDLLFRSLADTTRRDILRRVARKEYPITELARPYPLSFAAIAKHVSILEEACLVRKKRKGKQQIVSIVPKTFGRAREHLRRYEKIWEARYDNLESLLSK